MLDANHPLVSIAMCTYNGQQFLPQQLQSIIEQDYSNLEILIFDDGSSDNTPNILKEFQEKDPRIKYFCNHQNLGFIKNFEQALQSCNGEFIALSDQDDVWTTSKISTLMKEIEENLLIYSAEKIIDKNGHLTGKTFPKLKCIKTPALSLLLNNCVTGHTCLIKKELIEQALPIPNNIFAHDQWLALVASSQEKLTFSQGIHSYYRQHESNIILNNKKRKTSKTKKNMIKTEKLINTCQELINKHLLKDNDQELLDTFLQLLKDNKKVWKNRRLHKFLTENSEYFLALYAKEKQQRAIKNICRGKYFYRTLDTLKLST